MYGNIPDILKSLAGHIAAMKGNVGQHESALSQAKFDVEGHTALIENARLNFEHARELLKEPSMTGKAAYQMAVAQLTGARAQANQMTAELAPSKADLARATRDLGTLGEDNPRLRGAEADLEIAPLNLNFVKVRAPADGYVPNFTIACSG
jgi:membrane fusion protein, multidrug efflux system